MAVVTIALVQLDVSEKEPVDDRVARALELVAETAADADIVVLPELWHVGAFDLDGAREHAEPLDGPLVTSLRATALDACTWVHAGSYAERDAEGRTYNTSLVLGPDGQLAATYRKIHLFGFDGGEATVMTAGDELVVVDTVCGPTGIATCYDLRFPELFRGLVDRGALVTLIASGWPSARISHWSVLARARAIENEMVIAACNAAGTHAGVTMGGRSVIVDAAGEVLAEAGTGEEVIAASVDLDEVAAWREAFPVLRDRRL